MNLYSIILVDDEEEVRKSIIKQIDWESAGFQVVGDAENGEDALEKIEVLEPDVVLTDIRMPYMDGLTLAEKIRQRYPSTKVVIFSGYDDFEYAQKAIKLNVTEYILKPVNVEELTSILKRIKSNLDEEIEEKRNVSRLRENYRKSLPIIREQFFNDMVHRRLADDLIESKLREYDIPITGARKWIIAAIDVEKSDDRSKKTLSLHEEEELIPISVMQIVREKLKSYCRFSLFQSTAEAGMVVIAALDDDNTTTGLIDVLGDICKETFWRFRSPSASATALPGFRRSQGPTSRRWKPWDTRRWWAAESRSISMIWSRWAAANWNLTIRTSLILFLLSSSVRMRRLKP